MVSRDYLDSLLQAFFIASQEIARKISVVLWEYPQTRSSVQYYKQRVCGHKILNFDINAEFSIIIVCLKNIYS